MNVNVIKYESQEMIKKNPLIFVHGAFHNAHCWERYFLPYFSKCGFSCYAIHLSGHDRNNSNQDINQFGLFNYQEDVLRVIKQMSQKPILVGHSMGGAIVQQLAIKYPEQIKAIILLAPVPPWGMQSELLRIMLLRPKNFYTMLKYNANKSKTFPLKLLFSDTHIKHTKYNELKLLQIESEKAIEECMHPLYNEHQTLQIPRLIIGSRKDKFIHYKTTLKVGKKYNSVPIILNGGSHDLMLEENYQETVAYMLQFINQQLNN